MHFNLFFDVLISILSFCREKNKKRAEQGAALVCLCALGVIDEELLKKNGSLRK